MFDLFSWCACSVNAMGVNTPHQKVKAVVCKESWRHVTHRFVFMAHPNSSSPVPLCLFRQFNGYQYPIKE
jgi:hypothetical protein